MNDRPEREDGELERLRAEMAALRGKLRRLECDRAPGGDRCGRPDGSQVIYDPPLLNPFSACLLILACFNLAFMAFLAFQ